MKFAVSLVLGCLFFGFLNLATSDLQHAKEHELMAAANITEQMKEHDRSGAISVASASLSGQSLSPSRPVDLVECYSCTNCPFVDSGTLVKLCPYSLDPTKQGRCVAYAEQYKHMLLPWIIRGCASERGSCADIRRAHEAHSDVVNLLSCHDCVGDRCNGASHSMADFTMACLVMMVTPLIAKFTLS